MSFSTAHTSPAGRQTQSLSMTTFFTLAMLLAGFVNAQGWIIPMMPPLTISRMDPIVNPGGVANHVHNVVGGSAFDRAYRVATPEAGIVARQRIEGAEVAGKGIRTS